jgi:hypothetical protein
MSFAVFCTVNFILALHLRSPLESKKWEDGVVVVVARKGYRVDLGMVQVVPETREWVGWGLYILHFMQ